MLKFAKIITRGIKWISIVWFFLIIFTTLIGGCGAQRRPPKLTLTEGSVINIAPLNLTVGIEKSINPARTNELLNALRNTKIFKQVDLLKNYTQSPDLVAEYKYLDAANPIPLFTIISLGIIPTIFDNYVNQQVIFHNTAKTKKTGPIDFSYRGKTVMGIASIFFYLIPGWGVSGGYLSSILNYGYRFENDERFYNRLKSRLVNKFPALLQLSKRSHR